MVATLLSSNGQRPVQSKTRSVAFVSYRSQLMKPSMRWSPQPMCSLTGDGFNPCPIMFSAADDDAAALKGRIFSDTLLIIRQLLHLVLNLLTHHAWMRPDFNFRLGPFHLAEEI